MLHFHQNFHSLPAIDGGLEATAVDDGLGDRQFIKVDFHTVRRGFFLRG